MGVIEYSTEITSAVPPAKMFKAAVLDADNLIPRILPQAIKSVQILEGDGGVGTIKLITFGEGSQYKSVKHRVDLIDEGSLTFRYSIIEGDALADKLEKVSYEIKIEASADGGSVCKNTSKYYAVGEASITEEQIKSGKEKASSIFKAIEAYLIANPDAY